MRFRLIAVFLVLAAAWPAIAQDQPRRERPGRDSSMRQRGERRGRSPGMMLNRMASRMVRELELNSDQEAELDEIVADFREELGGARGSSPETQELRERFREARESGDQGRIRELGSQLRETRRTGMREIVNGFFEEVETILDEQQTAKLGEFRQQMQQRGRQRGPGGRGMMRRTLRELPEKLSLDEEQQTQFDGLLDQLREQGEARRTRMQELRPLFEEMRQAREEGDEERAESLATQVREARSEGDNPLESFFGELEKILRDDQKAKLTELRASLEQPSRREASQRTDLRTILQAVRRLDLDDKQRQEVTKITEEAMRASRELERRDREAQTVLAEKVKKQIVEVLRADQVEQFESVLKGERPRRDRDDRRGERRRQGGERRNPRAEAQP